MFSPQGNDNLISNNASIAANSALYSFDDSKNKANIVSEKHENKKGAFANFARISCFDDEIGWVSGNLSSTSNDLYSTHDFASTGLYKPFGVSNDNPLGKNIYSYSMSSATAVRGIAFANGGRGFVENPLAKPYNIVDNTYEFNRTITNNDFNDVINVTKSEKIEDLSRVEITPVAYNTYQISDILKETKSSQIIDFKPIPQELALTKPSKFRSFFGSQIELIRNLKNMFIRSKVK
ncbi:MAG: hypothetical protein IJX99_02415 [Clostridia bacterium]|nr:hypothetical protein [Clostridia bacterium]